MHGHSSKAAEGAAVEARAADDARLADRDTARQQAGRPFGLRAPPAMGHGQADHRRYALPIEDAWL